MRISAQTCALCTDALASWAFPTTPRVVSFRTFAGNTKQITYGFTLRLCLSEIARAKKSCFRFRLPFFYPLCGLKFQTNFNGIFLYTKETARFHCRFFRKAPQRFSASEYIGIFCLPIHFCFSTESEAGRTGDSVLNNKTVKHHSCALPLSCANTFSFRACAKVHIGIVNAKSRKRNAFGSKLTRSISAQSMRGIAFRGT